MRPFFINNTPIGLRHPCFIIAEAGSNHNGDLEIAKQLIHAAADSGADAVKFQTFKASKLYPKSAGKSDYLGSETSIYDIIQAMEMPEAWLESLCDLTHTLGMAFISSPFHEEAVTLLAPYVDAFKVASYELTHEPLLRAVAQHNKPIIMSTGASRIQEVRESVELLRSLGCTALVVLQCTAAYPAPPESAQVEALVHLRENLGVLTGLSDHTKNPTIAPATAAALGAVVIEKHYTLSQRLPGPDHPFAVEPSGLKALVKSVRAAEVARGQGRKFLHPVEGELRDFARRSLFTTRSIRAGERFSSENIDILRQGKLGAGLAPSALSMIHGAVAAHDIEPESPLNLEDVVLPEGVTAPQVGEPSPTMLRPASLKDLGLVWVWANDPLTRAASLQSAPISYTTHQAWFEARLKDLDERREDLEAHWLSVGRMWIAERGADPVAFLRLDPIERDEVSDEQSAVISIHVSSRARGEGVGRASLIALEHLARAEGLTELLALIDPLNAQSLRLFESVGYTSIDPESVKAPLSKRESKSPLRLRLAL